MAVVSFTLSAVDRTRAAFASVNQGLRNINRTVAGLNSSRSLVGMGLRLTGIGAAIAVVGSQVRRAASDIENIPGVSRDQIRSWDELGVRVGVIRDTFANMVTMAGSWINSGLTNIRYSWMASMRGVDAAQADLLANERALAEQAKIASGHYERLGEANKELFEARKKLNQVGESAGQSISRRRQEATLLAKSAVAMTDEIESRRRMAESIQLQAEAEGDFIKLTERKNKLIDESDMAMRRLRGSTIPLRKHISELTEANRELFDAMNAVRASKLPEDIERFNELQEKLTRNTDELTRANQELLRPAREAANIITGGFEDAIFAGEGLRGMLRGIGQDLMRYIFSQTITKSLGGSIVGGISAILGVGGPKIDISGLRAAGGPVSGGSRYIVGENGPELFEAQQSGRIVPNGAMAGGGNTYVIDARGTDESVVARLSTALMQLAGPGVVERRAINATSDLRMRRAGA